MATNAIKITTKDDQIFEEVFTDGDENVMTQLAKKITKLEEDGHWISRVEMRQLDDTPKA